MVKEAIFFSFIISLTYRFMVVNFIETMFVSGGNNERKCIFFCFFNVP